MLRSRVSTDFEQYRAMLKLLRGVARGSGRGAVKDVYSQGNISKLGTAVGSRKSVCTEESLRTEEAGSVSVLDIVTCIQRHPHGFKGKKTKKTPRKFSFPEKKRGKKIKKRKEKDSSPSCYTRFEGHSFLLVLEYRTIIFHRIHNLSNDWFAATGTKLHPLKGKKSSSILPYSVRGVNTQTAVLARQKPVHAEDSRRDLTRNEDPFDSITDKIPERPVSVAEGASYSVVILLGLAVAGAAAYAVFKELVFEPKEYKVFGKALNRVQNDNQVSVRLGSPITGYGQESRNRAARQRISNRAWTDEAGIERVEVMFHIRGPAGAGKVYSEMFKDPEDKTWKYTYLIVDVTSPSPTRLMLESYVPPLAPLNAL